MISHRWQSCATLDTKTTYLNLFTGSGRDPFFRLLPIFVEKQEATLSTSLDKLIRFSNELGVEDPGGDLGLGRDGTSRRIPGDLRYFWGRIDEGRGYSGILGNRRATLEPVGQEQFSVELVDSYGRRGNASDNESDMKKTRNDE
jgi:hypothetical protein